MKTSTNPSKREIGKKKTEELSSAYLIIIIAVIVVLVAWMFGIHIYSSLTLGFLVLFALSLFLTKNKRTILPLVVIWFIVILWVLAYTIYKCICDRTACPFYRN